MYSVRAIFSEDRLDVAVENFNTYPEALSYQIDYAKQHRDNSNIRTVYVKKINLDVMLFIIKNFLQLYNQNTNLCYKP